MRDYRIRQATADEVATMIEWAAREGWNPGHDDLVPFRMADPEGYWVGEAEGRMTAAISLVHHQTSYAFLGFYIVDPAYRGRGIGYNLWRSVLERSRARTIGLDGVVAQQANYRKSGFVYAHANWRFGGVIAQGAADPDFAAVTPIHQKAVLAYDAAMNPSARPRFAAAWYTDTAIRHSACLIRDGKIAALGTIRACREGHKVGPLFADDEATAERLFLHLVHLAGGGTIYLDIPQPNAAARALSERHGMTPVFETARMYRGDAPALPLAKIFGITTFELG
jgi:GNAT superfamily N-acetyltransferase